MVLRLKGDFILTFVFSAKVLLSKKEQEKLQWFITNMAFCWSLILVLLQCGGSLFWNTQSFTVFNMI